MYHFTLQRHEHLSAAQLHELGLFRHRVFVSRLGWDLPGVRRDTLIEFDEFDTTGTSYVLARDGKHNLIGCTRLLPTTRPYLLGQVFAHLCGDSVPHDPQIWELSRYGAASDLHPGLGIDLFKGSLRFAAHLGARDVIAVTNTSIERYFRREKVQFRRLCAPVAHAHEHLVALDFCANQYSQLEAS
ncbi:acyl-homoserine-lactone synthase [Pseudomonas cremoricolorata]|uniref:acyl-homoserine-lactone synthase n=1 Tax=Pseudomonas cremoricolorata TaxID=157783 RepID=UPI000B229F00|nr:acyl-homoserine-lactone synthase [Pseudomonas cremoricolorata]